MPFGGALIYVPVDWVKPAEGGVERLLNVYVSMGVTPPMSVPRLSKPPRQGGDQAASAQAAKPNDEPQLAADGANRAVPTGDSRGQTTYRPLPTPQR